MTEPPPLVPIVPGQPYQQPAPAAPPPPVPPRPGPKKGLSAGAIVGIIVGGLALLGALCCLGLVYIGTVGGGGTKSDSDVAVRLDGCSQARGFYRATLIVTNNGTRARSVYVDIEWLDPGNGERLASTTEVVSSVDPGQTAREEALATGTDDRAAVRCSYQVR